MVVYSCKTCGEPNFLTPHAFWNITDFGAKCEKCGEYRYLTPHAFWNVNDLNLKCKDCGTIGC